MATEPDSFNLKAVAMRRMSMLAAVFHARGDVRLERMPRPVPGPGEVLLEMRACGICGSDLLDWYVARKAPAVLGHEPVGVVAEVGAGDGLPAVGRRVFAHHHVPCGECARCRSGHETLCDTFKRTRIVPGGFAELILVPAENAALDLLELPDAVSDAAGTAIEPLACAVRGLGRARVGVGSRLLVVGGGQMGLLCALAGRARGAHVVVAEPLEERRAVARGVGVEAVEPDAGAVRAGLDAVVGGGPVAAAAGAGFVDAAAGGGSDGVGAAPPAAVHACVDAVLLCTGAEAAWELALGCVEPGGVVQLFAPAALGARRSFDVNEVFFSEIEIQASYSAGPADTREALELIASGAVDPEPLITHRFPLAEVGEALEAARERRALKAIVVA